MIPPAKIEKKAIKLRMIRNSEYPHAVSLSLFGNSVGRQTECEE